jgi:predicted ester cyclase
MVAKQKAREGTLRWIEAVNSRDMSLIDQVADEFFAADYVWHFPGVRDLPPGPAGMKQMLRRILGGNPDLKFTLEDLFVEGDKVAVRCTMHRKDPVTGKSQHGTNLVLSRFVGDKAAEDWELISPWEDEA